MKRVLIDSGQCPWVTEGLKLVEVWTATPPAQLWETLSWQLIPLYGGLTIIYMISDESIWTANKIFWNCTDLCSDNHLTLWVIKPIEALFLQTLHTCLIWWWVLLVFLGLQLDITGDMKHNLLMEAKCLILFFLETNNYNFHFGGSLAGNESYLSNCI